MRPGRGAAQYLARKRVSRGDRARYLGDPQTGRLPTWPDRTFMTIASIRITGIHRIQGPGPDWCGSIDLDLRAFAPRCRRLEQACSRAADRFQRVFGEVGDYRCGNRLGVGPHGKLRRFARYER
jgi:hypothetical protein